jgi:hypothetical protein
MDVWKGEVIASAEEELLSGIQGGSREDGDRDVASDRQSGEGARPSGGVIRPDPAAPGLGVTFRDAGAERYRAA